MFKRKGITPVIAIVLLLLITVGAVTVVYSQFQGLVSENDPSDTLDEQQRLQEASYSIDGVTRSNGNYAVIIRNTGDQVFDLDADSSLMMGHDGGQQVSIEARGGSCNWNGDPQVQSGETVTCDTQIQWDRNEVDDNGDATRFELLIEDVSQDTYSCSERSGDEFC